MAVPVIGAALVIAGHRPTFTCCRVGARAPTFSARGAGFLFLVFVALANPHYCYPGPRKDQSALGSGFIWVLLALLISIGTYLLIENPIRHSERIRARRWASIILGGCLVASCLVATTIVVHRERSQTNAVIDIGGTEGAPCPLPSKSEVAGLRSAYQMDSNSMHPTLPGDKGVRMLVVGDSTGCSLLPGLEAVGASYGVKTYDDSVLACGVVSGAYPPAFVNGVNIQAYSNKCQSKANAAEDLAIRRDRPNVILWASTVELGSIVINTDAGQMVLPSGSRRWTSVMKRRMHRPRREFPSDRSERSVSAGAPPR